MFVTNAALAYYPQLLRGSPRAPSMGAPVVDTAPDFTLKVIAENKRFTLSSLRGKIVLMNFWISWCPTCNAEQAEVERVWKTHYKDSDVVFVGVDLPEPEEDAIAYIRKYNVSYVNLIDKEGEIIFRYGVRVTPTTIFITKDGRIAFSYEGPLEEKQIHSFIEYTRRLSG